MSLRDKYTNDEWDIMEEKAKISSNPLKNPLTEIIEDFRPLYSLCVRLLEEFPLMENYLEKLKHHFDDEKINK